MSSCHQDNQGAIAKHLRATWYALKVSPCTRRFWAYQQSVSTSALIRLFLYRSPFHEEALANLIYGVTSRKGFIMLTGEVGTGKTTLLECLRDYLTSHHTPFGFIFNSRLTPQQFFEMLAWDFDLQCNRSSKTEVLFALNNLLLERANQNLTTALIVDEAQNLDWDVLEEIRMLGNLENRRGKMIQVILSGQPELRSKTRRAELPPAPPADKVCVAACAPSAQRKQPTSERASPAPKA